MGRRTGYARPGGSTRLLSLENHWNLYITEASTRPWEELRALVLETYPTLGRLVVTRYEAAKQAVVDYTARVLAGEEPADELFENPHMDRLLVESGHLYLLGAMAIAQTDGVVLP